MDQHDGDSSGRGTATQHEAHEVRPLRDKNISCCSSHVAYSTRFSSNHVEHAFASAQDPRALGCRVFPAPRYTGVPRKSLMSRLCQATLWTATPALEMTGNRRGPEPSTVRSKVQPGDGLPVRGPIGHHALRKFKVSPVPGGPPGPDFVGPGPGPRLGAGGPNLESLIANNS